MNILVNLEYK